MRWGMVIDLSKCIGCYSCVLACRAENGTPSSIFFKRILWHEEGKYPDGKRFHIPCNCNHCKEAACVEVCPTGATFKNDDGLVVIDETKCVGCRYCMMACPYKNRYFLGERVPYFPENGLTPHEIMGGEARIDWENKLNTVIKCNFCEHRLKKAEGNHLKPGVDREVTPACVATCPAEAMYFGDLDDPTSEVSRLIIKRSGFSLMPEANTEPSVYYLPA